jgi:hypothetical protein
MLVLTKQHPGGARTARRASRFSCCAPASSPSSRTPLFSRFLGSPSLSQAPLLLMHSTSTFMPL